MTSIASFLLVTVVGQTAPATELLEFTAPGCPACVRMEPVVKRLKQRGYRVRQVQATQSNPLVRRYRINRLPTFVALANGREVDRLVGLASYDRLAQMMGRPKSPSSVRPVSAIRPVSSGDRSTDCRRATVRISIEERDGYVIGAGTIIHKRDDSILVATCGHIFRHFDPKTQPLTVELFNGGSKPLKLKAQLIRKDLRNDIALITFNTTKPVAVARLAAPKFAVSAGQSVFTVGCPRGAAPAVRYARVTTINRYNRAPNIEVSGLPVDGCSGGGLFALDGTLIGICNFADPDDKEGIFVAYPAIHQHMIDANLRVVLNALFPKNRERSIPTDRNNVATTVVPPLKNQTVDERSGKPRPITVKELNRDAASIGSKTISLPSRIQPKAEVMIIVRSKDGSSRLVVLKNPSAKLLQMIRQESQNRVEQTARTRPVRRQPRIRSASTIIRGQR